MTASAPLDQAWGYPLFEALYRRRSRRFGLGFEMQEGPFRYKSAHAPVPLTQLEEALLVGAGAGFTGLAFWDLPTPAPYPRLSGRTFPTTQAGGHTALFLTNDEGFYVIEDKVAPASCARSKPGRSAASSWTPTVPSVGRLSQVGSTFPAACRR